MIKKAFTEHPASVGETYLGHMGMAFGFGGKMIVSGIACLLHGLFPFLFTTTGKKCIEELHFSMVTHRDTRTHENGTMPAMKADPAQLTPAE